MKKTRQGVRDLNNLKGNKPSNVKKLDYDARVQLDEEEVADSFCEHLFVPQIDERKLMVFGQKEMTNVCKKCGVPEHALEG
jgi:hypothetical protein